VRAYIPTPNPIAIAKPVAAVKTTPVADEVAVMNAVEVPTPKVV
jgi:hypothetical protein